MYLRRTALFYHADMIKHENQLHSNYHECPDRLKKTYEKCNQNGLLSRCLMMQVCPQCSSPCYPFNLQPHHIPDEILRLAHTQEYIDQVDSTAEMTDKARSDYMQKFDCASFNKVGVNFFYKTQLLGNEQCSSTCCGSHDSCR